MLSWEAFAKNRASRDGYQVYCRECSASYHQQRQVARGKNVRPRVTAPEGHKFCRTCGTTKPHSEWSRNRRSSDGFATLCKSCKAESQMGPCVTCLSAPAVHVDHCHQTGRVRGVLCFNCNSAIGKLGDDPDTVRRAAAYLEGTSWKPTLVAPGVYQLPS
nr:endonuclease VII domain-containing protein [Streptomyces hundungensis]